MVNDELCHERFLAPPKGYGAIAWWVWNGRMEYAEIQRQLETMAQAGLEGWMLWARFGLEVEYLSDAFLQRIRFAVEKSAALGLDVWIYDEFAWPSGTAQNRVVKDCPAYRMRVLSCIREVVRGGQTVQRSYALPAGEATGLSGAIAAEGVFGGMETADDGRRVERVLAVPMNGGEADPMRTVNVTDCLRGFELAWTAPPGQWQLLTLISRDNRSFVDSMNPDAVGAFIAQTHERYKAYIGSFFGTVVKGFFLDEPRYLRRGVEKPQYDEPTVPFSDQLLGRLVQSGLEDVNVALASVFCEIPSPTAQVQSARVRFWRAMTGLYRDAYFGQLSDWCQRHGMTYCGDCFSEERVLLMGMGDYLRVAAPLHRPGMDSLCDVPLNDPEYRKAPKFPASLAHYQGGRAMAEGPGLLGWDATLVRLKANTDWMLAYGITFFVPNSFLYTIAHEQFYEPPSYFYQWTLWPHYRDYELYTRRLSWVLSQGRHCADVAIVYPTASLWSHYAPPPMRMRNGEALQESEMSPALREVYNGIVRLSDELLRRQIDFDYIGEEWLASAKLVEGKVQIGKEMFDTLLLPEMPCMSAAAWRAICDLAAGGVRVMAVGSIPTCLWDESDSEPRVPPAVKRVTTAEVVAAVRGRVHLTPRTAGGSTADFVTQLRRTELGDVVFIANLSATQQDVGLQIRTDGAGIERWDPLTGQREVVAANRNGDVLSFDYTFAPNDSLLLVCRDGLSRGERSVPRRVVATLPSRWQFEALDDNLYLPPSLQVSQMWTKRLAWEGVATYGYEFTLRLAAVPPRLFVVLDHVQTYWRLGRLRMIVNGVACRLSPSDVLDREMIRGDLVAAARAGENRIRIELDYTDYADTAADLHSKRTAPPVVPKVRVMGHFALLGEQLSLAEFRTVGYGSWTEWGYPLYSGRARYSCEFHMPDEVAAVRTWLVLDTPAEVVEIRLNGSPVGKILWPPFKLEVTGVLRPGVNALELTVTNSQANQMYEQARPSGLLGAVRIEASS